ncbi:MAG: phosphoribosyltransferase family protein [Candidatus Brocadiaceae bacterium]|jgi:predicted phosphoribosyltransferase
MRHIGELVESPRAVFEDRADAGRRLGHFLRREDASVEAIVAVPSGGVAVARPVAEQFDVPLDIVLVRKLPFPWAPEAGFGAVTLERDVVLDRRAAGSAGLTEQSIQRIIDRVLEGLHQRAERFEDAREPLDVGGKDVLLVDDGLATGVTMRAAVGEMRRKEAATVSVAVGDAPLRTVETVEPLVNHIYCLFAQQSGPFAVASFYCNWRDLPEGEAVELLRELTRQRAQAE